MDLAVNFYIQAVLCILTFVTIFLLIQSNNNLKKQIDKDTERD